MDRASGGSPLGVPMQAVQVSGAQQSDATLSLPLAQVLMKMQRRIRLRVRNRKLAEAAKLSGQRISDDVRIELEREAKLAEDRKLHHQALLRQMEEAKEREAAAEAAAAAAAAPSRK